VKIKLSQPQVHRVMARLKQERALQPALEPLPVADDEGGGASAAVSSEPESGSGVAQGEWRPAEQLSGQSAVLTLAPGSTVSSRYLRMLRFGILQVFTEVFCLALLQEPSVERVKHLLRSDLGAVMGSSRAACVKRCVANWRR